MPSLCPCPWQNTFPLVLSLCFFLHFCSMKVISVTDPTDKLVLQSFLESVTNPTKLSGWGNGDPCEGWENVICTGTGTRVTQLQLKGLGLEGRLPANFNQLSSLEQIALQGNFLSGPLPSFSGLSMLTTAYLGSQNFNSIPSDFFKGLKSLQILTLEHNPINSSEGWSIPADITEASGLTTLVLSNTSLSGPIPEFFGSFTNLNELRISYNRFVGGIPSSFRNLSQLSIFKLNNNAASLSGPIDVVVSMASLKVLWLHVNQFSGPIPSGVGSLLSLEDCRLNDNQLVGIVPATFSTSESLKTLYLQGNQLLGPIPKLSIGNDNFTYDGNKFCQSEVGVACTPEVSSIISFLGDLNYPSSLVTSWDGQTLCGSTRQALRGVTCDANGMVISINLANNQLSGLISPALANLSSLTALILNDNNLTGTIPESLTTLKFLRKIDVRNNNLYGPVPSFGTQVLVNISGNPNIGETAPDPSPSQENSPNSSNDQTRNIVPSSNSSSGSSPSDTPASKNSSSPLAAIVSAVIAVLVVAVIAIAFVFYKRRKRKFFRVQSPNTALLRAPGSGDEGDIVKVTVNKIDPSIENGIHHTCNGAQNMQLFEAGNLLISIQLLRSVTNDFSQENVLGEGGFGVVYKGELEDGTVIAVKRMLSSMVSGKGLQEFQSEIAVLTKLRHRHLVALLGYCMEGNERLLVYEYMPLGTLSQHLFDWRKLELSPLSWERRLSIALDVARGVEYLHGLAHESFIHRDLKPSNILLGDGFRAKVSDFGLVKHAPKGDKHSVETRLAGTFGYLAPEYAVTGRVTTKSDVFSFGVILMELLTGRKALDESQPEESMHLVTWFRRRLGNEGTLFESIDSAIAVNDGTSQSILVVAELAGHCTVREAYNRPDMGHVVNVLAGLVEQWKPSDVAEEEEGIDMHMTLPQVLKKWQISEGLSMSSDLMSAGTSVTSVSSLPSRPSGLAQTFTSMDGR
ncbi:hypothetical protein KP509_32G004700 [Ceratopteris richardii]|uniref:Protein kinase domain-containing protein n=1 Tax=Ceratopteris richardii TaxID=49495 RepID=A0A8T2QQY8_CERRI|nr:hypothetical protein KP509_32G004700 [Ceratopteris richardii]KAH7286377.1 hypothetical protein KP509_32G004700 [Ceratopteris richardii]